MRFLMLLPLLLCALTAQAQLKVAALHPLLLEMGECVGGKAVCMVPLYPANLELHEFAPDVSTVAAATGCRLVLAMGKGVEPYLHDLSESLPDAEILPLGDTLPDTLVPGTPHRDPHWWNSPALMRRAARALRDELAEHEPEHAEDFRRGYAAYAAMTEGLEREARLALAKLPPEHRVLVTEHAALCHFCKDFRLTPIAVYGVSKESEGDTAGMARLLTELRARRVPCLFTEFNENPRALQTLARETGAVTRPLIMDGVAPQMQSYAAIFRHNLNQIVQGLCPRN